jgi:OmpA-OmpF porin, OOP family
MKSTPVLTLLSLASLGCLATTASVAQQDMSGSYPYVGVSVGRAKANVDEPNIAAAVTGPGVTHTITTSDERRTGYKVFGGYQMNRYFGVEAGYFNLGKSTFESTTVPAGTLNGQLRAEGFNLDLVGTAPLSENFSLIGRIGAQNAKTRGTFAGTGAALVANPTPSRRETNYKAGVGMQYAVTSSMLLRAEVERYRINDAVGEKAGVNLFSLSLVFPLGRTSTARATPVAYVPPAPMPVAPPPAPVAIAETMPVPVPVPAPVAAPAPPPPPPVKRVSFAAETLFGFDRADLRPAGNVSLDNFLKELESTKYDSINVIGHTDRLGTAAYNQSLSEQRANAVKNYLVNNGKLDASKVTAAGKGETTALTNAADCKGNKASVKLIVCLQPDRRVDLDVNGTR